MANNLANRSRKMGLTAYLTQDAVKNQINSVIGKDGQRFITAVVSAVNTNPMLQECSNQSILSAALLGESLKLSPSPQLGHYYIVPYKDKNRGMVGQFQIGYKGLIQLAIRSEQYKKLNVLAIKEGELVKFDALNEDIEVNLIEDEEKRENTPTVGYYAMFEYVNGFRKAIYWSRAKMERHALRYSKGYQAKKGYTFWEKDFDAMAYKTMLRQLISKWGIMSIDMISAVEKDMAVIQPDGSAVYVDNEPEDDPEVVTATAEVVETSAEGEKVAETKPANDVQAALFG